MMRPAPPRPYPLSAAAWSGTFTALLPPDVYDIREAFTAVFSAIAPAQNKYMALLFNSAADRVIKVHRVVVVSTRDNGSAGAVTTDMELRRVASYVSGTPITPAPFDTLRPLAAGITADTGSSAVVDGALIKRFVCTPGQQNSSQINPLPANYVNAEVFYELDSPIVLRAGGGLALKMITNTTVGELSFEIDFTQHRI